MPLRLLVLLVLAVPLATVAPVTAQDVPTPGTGLLLFERVGDGRRLQTFGFTFSQDGILFASADSLYRFESARDGPPAGRWIGLSKRRSFFDAVTTVGATADTLLVGWQGGILRSVDRGVTWSSVHAAGPNKPAAFFALPAGHAHAGRLLAGGAILYSDDRGTSWTEATRAFPGEQGRAYAFAALPSGRVLMAGSWGVAASDDGGGSYAVTPLWGDYHFETYSITALATPGSIQSGTPDCGQADPALCDGAVVIGIDATAEHVRAWRTSDGGRTWSAAVPLPEPYDGVGAGATAGVVALSPGPDRLGRALMLGGRGVLYRTLDGAETWEAVARMPIHVGSPSHTPQFVRIGPDGHLWVSTIRNGHIGEYMYRSIKSSKYAFIMTNNVAAPETSGLRLTVRPNPASASAVAEIALTTPVASAIVEVHDAQGRQVARLHEGPLTVTRLFNLSTARWAAGIYTVHALVDGTVITARLTVAR